VATNKNPNLKVTAKRGREFDPRWRELGLPLNLRDTTKKVEGGFSIAVKINHPCGGYSFCNFDYSGKSGGMIASQLGYIAPLHPRRQFWLDRLEENFSTGSLRR
jgi:hypothetical protein